MRTNHLLRRLTAYTIYLATGAVLLLTSACSRENINRSEQSGVWRIKRVSYTTYNDSTGAVLTTTTTTDAGQVAFVAVAGQIGSINAEARFYIDRQLTSPVLAALDGGPGTVTVAAGRTVPAEWIVEQNVRRRILLRTFDQDNVFLALTSFAFTITDESNTTQRWERVVGNTTGTGIRQREEWEIEREE